MSKATSAAAAAAATATAAAGRNVVASAIDASWAEACAAHSDIKQWRVSTPEERVKNAAARDAVREHWLLDPRYRGTLAFHFREEVHQHFRQRFGAIREAVVRAGKINKAVRADFRETVHSLEGHHQGEDRIYFPRMMRKEPLLVGPMAWLAKDHKHLDPLEKKVLSEEEGDAAAAAEACVEFVDFLFDHLAREEMLVVPQIMKGAY
jgi:hypothetical protein